VIEVPTFVVVLVTLAPLVVLVMIWAFARNAIAMKRDLDQRFERLRKDLETDANETIDPLLRERSGDNGSG
jgi:hypothetical protein